LKDGGAVCHIKKLPEFKKSMVDIEGYLPFIPRCCGNHLLQRQMITQAVNLLNWISSGKFTRELNKESLLN